MYCYFSEYKKNNLNLDVLDLQNKADKIDDILSLFTCNRVEFYSENKIDFLENNKNFIKISNIEEIYNHFLKVVL
jgi:glutamyl-tRNA reductase